MNPALAMPEEGMTLDELSNFVAEQLKRLNMVLKNIDGLNIVDIKFELQGGAYIQLNRKGLVFNNGTFDTLLVDINGHVSATAMDLSTTPGSYPRVEINSGTNLFAAYKSATEYVAISPSYVGSPAMRMVSPHAEGFISAAELFGYVWFNVTTGDMYLQSQSGDIILDASGLVKVFGWDKVVNDTGETLQEALDGVGSTGGGSTIVSADLTPNRAVISNGSGKIAVSPTTSTELGYVSGTTSPVQSQINGKASKTLPSWTAPTLQNSWIDFPGFAPSGYYKDDMSVVRLRGLIKSGTVGAVIFNLPAGYRPLYDSNQPVDSNSAYGKLTIQPSGNVILNVGSNAYVDLSSISFRAEQ